MDQGSKAFHCPIPSDLADRGSGRIVVYTLEKEAVF